MVAYSPICETFHTKSIYLKSYCCCIMKNKRLELLQIRYLVWSMYKTCILNTYVYLKLYKQNINLRQWNLQTHFYWGFFLKKDMCTFSLWRIYLTLSMLDFNLWVCVWGGRYFCVLFKCYFFEFRAKHQIIFLPNKQNLEEKFHRQRF